MNKRTRLREEENGRVQENQTQKKREKGTKIIKTRTSKPDLEREQENHEIEFEREQA